MVGNDLSESMLRTARRKAHGRNVTFRVADARERPFQDARFDVCCVSFGLHEMPVSVPHQALFDMARVTKNSGKLVIVDYALPEPPIATKLVYHLVKLYERDNYAEFVRSDISTSARTMACIAPRSRSAALARNPGSRRSKVWVPARAPPRSLLRPVSAPADALQAGDRIEHG